MENWFASSCSPLRAFASLPRRRRRTLKGSSRNPSLIAPSRSAVLISKRRSLDSRCRNLRKGCILCLSMGSALASFWSIKLLFSLQRYNVVLVREGHAERRLRPIALHRVLRSEHVQQLALIKIHHPTHRLRTISS